MVEKACRVIDSGVEKACANGALDLVFVKILESISKLMFVVPALAGSPEFPPEGGTTIARRFWGASFVADV